MEKAMADKAAQLERGGTPAGGTSEVARKASEPDEDSGAGGQVEDDLEALRARRRQQL